MLSSLYSYGTARGWEALPGALLWGTLVLAVVLSLVFPVAMVVFVILFDVYWLFRVLYFVVYLVISWRQYRRCVHTNWAEKIQELPAARRLLHIVMLPTYTEEYPVIRETLRALVRCSFQKDRMILVLAGEARDHERFERNADAAKREFGPLFRDLVVTEHPVGLPDEIPGKGSNLNWAGHRLAEYLSQHEPNWSEEDIIVSSFDIDTIVHPQYFAYLSYLYATVPDPSHASYQPVTLFSNNIWSAPAPVRVAAFGTTFWLLTELARPERLWTFSSHSMPWKMLKDVGFWQKDVVSEDSRIFLQGLLHYHGAYRVVPMFLPVSMDAVGGRHYLDALRALYVQQRRWAWGVEHFPLMVKAFARDHLIPRRVKIKYLFNHLEGMYTWATAPLLIFLLGWMPFLFGTREDLVLIQSAPQTLQWLMRLAMIGVFVSATLSMVLLPPRPKTLRPHRWLIMLLQWLLLPVTFILFGSFPAVDAQTRLMVGKYLGFRVTKKSR